MKITVKTLKGGKFDIQAEAEQTVADVKGIIQTTKSELAESALKLIHSGKVLKDDDSLASCGIKENDFLVVMVSKPKKAVAKKETAPSPASETPATSTEIASKTAAETPAATASSTTTSAPSATTTPAPSTTTATTTPGAPAAADGFPEEVITNLTSMGFPEPEVRHCLRVAHGNPDVAVEFLTNGIPEGMGEAASLVQAASGTPAAATGGGGGGGGPLQSLRNHPQFNALKRLVQTNPGALQQVLAQIGQQQPDLLAEINANQAAFLEMMNEPITETPAAAGNPGATGAGGLPANMRSPQQMAQLIASMGDAELAQMAQMIGMTPEQLRATAQHASANGGGGGGETVLRLTPDEMAAVDRLTEMGFDRAEAAQAFLACDKNEALAANLLMDSMGGGGMFGGGGSNGGGAGGGGGDGSADDDDNMYD